MVKSIRNWLAVRETCSQLIDILNDSAEIMLDFVSNNPNTAIVVYFATDDENLGREFVRMYESSHNIKFKKIAEQIRRSLILKQY